MVEEPSHVEQLSSKKMYKVGLNHDYLFLKRVNSMVGEPSNVKQTSSKDVCKIGLKSSLPIQKRRENSMVAELPPRPPPPQGSPPPL
jgi:hypothetical protein